MSDYIRLKSSCLKHEQALSASNLVAHDIAKLKKPHLCGSITSDGAASITEKILGS